MLSSRALAVATLCALATAAPPAPAAAPASASLGLSTTTISPVIIGAQVPLNAFVYNLAAPGADPLDYTITYTLPDKSQFEDTGTRAADSGASFDFWQKFLDTSTSPLGINTTTIRVDAPDALNAPQVQQLSVNVLNHAFPGVWINGKIVTPAAQAPSSDPLAFGATGGGETFAAGAPNVIGDPPLSTPTAGLDLDFVHPHGDPQITITLAPTLDIAPDDDPTAGDPWTIDVDASHAGTFTTFFDLGFSDEQDLPGADAPGSIPWQFEVTATVSPDLSTVTGNLIVLPEPASATTMLAALLLLKRRGRRFTGV